jgi:hypothetical protein
MVANNHGRVAELVEIGVAASPAERGYPSVRVKVVAAQFP